MKQILAVDDDPDVLAVLAETLTEAGYLVEKASSVEEGAQRFETVRPHLVLLDLHLPDKNGSFLARKIKNNAATKHTPIILLSGMNDLAVIAKKVEADSFLAKPFDLEALLAVIDKFLK